MLATKKIKCYVCGTKKAVNDWHDYFQFDGHEFCCKRCADKYQRERTKQEINYYRGSMDQAGKFIHATQAFAIDDLPF